MEAATGNKQRPAVDTLTDGVAGRMVVSVALLVARRTNNRKVVGSMPANVVCITVDRYVTAWGKLSAVAGHQSFFRAVRSWSLRLSALMDSSSRPT